MALPENELQKFKTLPNPIDLNGLISNPECLKLYANGFSAGFSLSDATLVLQHGPLPVASVSMSYTTLKTLQSTINDLVAQVETTVGESLKSINDRREKLETNVKNFGSK